jgi:hypothetical protein
MHRSFCKCSLQREFFLSFFALDYSLNTIINLSLLCSQLGNIAQLRFQPAMLSNPDLHVFTMIQTVGCMNPRLDCSHQTASILLYPRIILCNNKIIIQCYILSPIHVYVFSSHFIACMHHSLTNLSLLSFFPSSFIPSSFRNILFSSFEHL